MKKLLKQIHLILAVETLRSVQLGLSHQSCSAQKNLFFTTSKDGMK